MNVRVSGRRSTYLEPKGTFRQRRNNSDIKWSVVPNACAALQKSQAVAGSSWHSEVNPSSLFASLFLSLILKNQNLSSSISS
jgi:hypothetical protein